MGKKRLTGLELERKRLERLRKKAHLKALRKTSVSGREVCPFCGRKHEPVKTLKGAVMASVTAVHASTSEKDSEGSSSTDSVEESLHDNPSQDSTSTATDTQEENT